MKRAPTKFILVTGLLAVLLSVSFPPYQVVWTRSETGTIVRETSIGFHFILAPPPSMDRNLVRINLTQLVLEIAAVLCLVGAGFVVASSSPRKSKGESKDDCAEGTRFGSRAESRNPPVAGESLSMDTEPSSSEGFGAQLPDERNACDRGNPPSQEGVKSSVLCTVSGIATLLFVVGRSSDSGVAAIVGGCIGSLLVGGVGSVVSWGFNAAFRGRKCLDPAVRIGFGLLMPLWAALSLVVHENVAPDIRRQIEKSSATARLEQLQKQTAMWKEHIDQGRILQRDALPSMPIEPIPMTNWHVSVITLDLPAEPRSENVLDKFRFEMSSNFVADITEPPLQVHVAFRRLRNRSATPEEVWREKVTKWETAEGMRVEGTTSLRKLGGHKALQWAGKVGGEKTMALVITGGRDYCIVGVTGSSDSVQANGERILSSINVVGFEN